MRNSLVATLGGKAHDSNKFITWFKQVDPNKFIQTSSFQQVDPNKFIQTSSFKQVYGIIQTSLDEQL